MNKQEVLEQLEILFRETLGKADITLTEATTANDVEGWDSLSNMTIIAKVEETFGCKFKFREIVKFGCIGDLCDAVVAKTNA